MRALFAAALVLLGCGEVAPEPALRGSAGQVYALDFAAVRCRRGTAELAVQYVARDGQVPVQLVLYDADFLADGTWTLPLVGTVVGSRDGVDLPALLEGEVLLEDYDPSPGGAVVGRFRATLAGGYSLIGDFAAAVELAGP